MCLHSQTCVCIKLSFGIFMVLRVSFFMFYGNHNDKAADSQHVKEWFSLQCCGGTTQ